MTTSMRPPQLLILEPDEQLRPALVDMLREEGCDPQAVATIAEALACADDRAFGLVLLDLSTEDDPRSLMSAQLVRRRVWPTPVGLLLSSAAFRRQEETTDFAFVLPVPCDVVDLFTLIALALAEPLEPEQEPRVRTIERYFSLLGAGNWDALLDLCTNYVTYTLLGISPFSRTIEGRSAFRAYTEETFGAFGQVSFDEVLVYPAADGLAARYTSTWAGSEGPQRQSGTVYFEFAADKIAHIRVRVNTSRLLPYLEGNPPPVAD